MKKVFFVFIFGIFLITLISASGIQICIDHTPPSAPSNLTVSSSGTNIILSWGIATDIPDCSGVDYYVISRDENQIGTTSSDTLSYTNKNVPYGTYSYTVYAVDKVGHNSGPAIKNDVVLSAPSSGGGSTTVSGGGGGSSYTCEPNWECSGWSECINNSMSRICEDTNNCAYSYNKPIERTECTNKSQENVTNPNIEPPKEKKFTSGLTGAVIGGIIDFSKSKFGASLIIAIVIILTGIVAVALGKKSKKKNS